MTGVPKTDDEPKFGRGNISASVVAIYHSKQFLNSTKDIAEGQQVGLLLDRTNFYAEQGGQEYDQGRILIDGEAELDVQNVQVYAGYVLHTGFIKYGTLSVGDKVTCQYDELRRFPIRNNHTGTHVLNHALREVLGNDVNQKGSSVAPERLRFDFSHKAAVTDKELEQIETMSTHNIRQNLPVYAKEVPLATAREIEGVRAVFGETYPDPVRVVSVGYPVDDLLKDPKNADWRHVSIEFCGGTHVDNTNEIKELVILEESGIAKGQRRIVAVTGQAAYEAQRQAAEFDKELGRLEKMPLGGDKEQLSKQTAQKLNELSVSALNKTAFKERLSKVTKSIVDEQKAVQKAENKKVVDMITKHFADNKDSKQFVAKLELSSGSKAVSEAIKHVSTKAKDKSIYLLAADTTEGKVSHGCHVAQDLGKQGASAGEWSKTVCEAVGGRAGGKEPTSVGNGTNVDKVDDGLELARKYLEKFQL